MNTTAAWSLLAIVVFAAAIVFLFLPGRGIRNNATQTIALTQTILAEFDIANDSSAIRLRGSGDGELESLSLNREIALALKNTMPKSQSRYIYGDGLFHDACG